MERAWNNGRANYRCHHPRLPGAEGLSVSVREDKITPHLGAALICTQASGRVALSNIDVPQECTSQAAAIRHLGVTPSYDHAAQTLNVPTRTGPVTICLH
jgi:hypothetical protein